jgi:hypothetical protein
MMSRRSLRSAIYLADLAIRIPARSVLAVLVMSEVSGNQRGLCRRTRVRAVRILPRPNCTVSLAGLRQDVPLRPIQGRESIPMRGYNPGPKPNRPIVVPLLTTCDTRERQLISTVGSPSTRMRSARLPTSKVRGRPTSGGRVSHPHGHRARRGGQRDGSSGLVDSASAGGRDVVDERR